MKEKVFICYRQETSKDFVGHLVDRLKEYFEVVWDQDNTSSGKIPDFIENGIDCCTHFILVVDKKTFEFKEEEEKDYVQQEIDLVLKIEKDKQTKIIPIVTPDCEWPSTEELKKYGFESLKDYTRYEMGDKEKFDDFFKKFVEEKMNYSLSDHKRRMMIKRLIIASAIFVICLFIGFFIGISYNEFISSKTTKLVFAGGGSVANMIEAITGKRLADYDNSFYIELPSENAWVLMPEDLTNDHHSDTIKNRFYPICLSALEVENDTIAFLKNSSDSVLRAKGNIVKYLLGYDTLKVFTQSKESYGDTISIDNLYKKIKEIQEKKVGYVYCTQEGSGTYHKYKKLLPNLTKDSLGNILQWYNKDSQGRGHFTRTDNYIILTSNYYTPIFIKERGDSGTLVLDSNKNPIKKDMYLLFTANKNGDKINIPNEMVVFLKEIVKNNDSLKDKTGKIKQEMKWTHDDLSIDFKELLKEQE